MEKWCIIISSQMTMKDLGLIKEGHILISSKLKIKRCKEMPYDLLMDLFLFSFPIFPVFLFHLLLKVCSSCSFTSPVCLSLFSPSHLSLSFSLFIIFPFLSLIPWHHLIFFFFPFSISLLRLQHNEMCVSSSMSF